MTTGRCQENDRLIPEKIHIALSINPETFLLMLLIFCCLGMQPVWSNPQDEYTGWFSQSKVQSAQGFSSVLSPPSPRASSTSQNHIQKCIFGNVLAGEEEENIVLLNETLVVDGCLLECGNKILHSTVTERSIMTVRNGGHVKNCDIVLIKTEDLENELLNIDRTDNISRGKEENTSATTAPTFVGTHFPTDSSKYMPETVTGFMCDQGACVLENSSCSALEFDSGEPPKSMLVMQECVLVQLGATDVRIQGGLVMGGSDPISLYGIVVDAGFNPEKRTSQGDEDKYANVRMFVDKATIRNQYGNGIIVVGGAKSIRINDSTISNNDNDGIYVYGGHGLKFFAVFGGSIENNAGSGINILEYQMQRNLTKNENNENLMLLPSEVEIFISRVLLKKNRENGLKVVRIDDIAIEGAIIDGNGLNGIDIWSANTIRLQDVVSKNNVRNGLSVEAEDSIVEISNSVFLGNGYDSRIKSPHWKRAGVYMWLPKRITIKNSVSNDNKMDGILIYDVPDLSFTDVDVMKNGNDGIEIRESSAAYNHDYTANSNYLVGAYYYPWHGKNFHNGGYLREKLIPPQSPTLGEYDDSDPDIISQHLEWFRKSNIGLLVTSWWGPDRIEDTNTLDVLMEHDYIGNLKIALHYETNGRIKNDTGEDMSITENDILYMCENYFNHPNYYKIDNRPVLVIYISRKLEKLGILESVLLTMRTVANKCGYNIYLIGDAIFAKAPEAKSSFAFFDAVTNYDVYGSSGAPKQDTTYATTDAVDNFYAEQEKWRDLALQENCRYIPPVSPGYNDRAVRLEKDNQPLSRRLTASSEEGSLFMYQLQKALPLVDPEVDNLILVNSFNEWHEDTQIEPVRGSSTNKDLQQDNNYKSSEPEELTFGLEYVAYGELYLDILRNATSRAVTEKKGAKVIYEPTRIDITNVRSCKNGYDGMRFYVTENSFDDQPEFIFNPGKGVISCENKGFDYELYGGGNVEFVSSSNDEMIGGTCVNGRQAFGCEFSNLLKPCKKRYCRQRDIVMSSGGVINDHKIQ